MLIIYGSDLSTPSNKVRFVANALGIEYDYRIVKLREGEHRSPEFLKLHPAGKVPVIDDDGFLLFESNAICKYLCDKRGSGLYPKDLRQRAVNDQWIDFCSHHVGAAANKVIYNRIFAPIRGVPVDENSLKEGISFLERFLPVVNGQIASYTFLTGKEMTIADINLLAILDPSEIAGIDLAPFPDITRWRNQLKKEDFYTRCYQEYGEVLKRPAGKK